MALRWTQFRSGKWNRLVCVDVESFCFWCRVHYQLVLVFIFCERFSFDLPSPSNLWDALTISFYSNKCNINILELILKGIFACVVPKKKIRFDAFRKWEWWFKWVEYVLSVGFLGKIVCVFAKLLNLSVQVRRYKRNDYGFSLCILSPSFF